MTGKLVRRPRCEKLLLLARGKEVLVILFFPPHPPLGPVGGGAFASASASASAAGCLWSLGISVTGCIRSSWWVELYNVARSKPFPLPPPQGRHCSFWENGHLPPPQAGGRDDVVLRSLESLWSLFEESVDGPLLSVFVGGAQTSYKQLW